MILILKMHVTHTLKYSYDNEGSVHAAQEEKQNLTSVRSVHVSMNE